MSQKCWSMRQLRASVCRTWSSPGEEAGGRWGRAAAPWSRPHRLERRPVTALGLVSPGAARPCAAPSRRCQARADPARGPSLQGTRGGSFLTPGCQGRAAAQPAAVTECRDLDVPPGCAAARVDAPTLPARTASPRGLANHQLCRRAKCQMDLPRVRGSVLGALLTTSRCAHVVTLQREEVKKISSTEQTQSLTTAMLYGQKKSPKIGITVGEVTAVAEKILQKDSGVKLQNLHHM